MATAPRAGGRIGIEGVSLRREAEFVLAARRSRRLHGSWVAAPETPADFRAYVKSKRGPAYASFFVLEPGGALAGVVNINEIVRGAFQSGYLGYYAFSPYEGRGHMSAGVAAVVQRAFAELALHRLEANIQPANAPSIALVRRLGFRYEGYSERYLKIAGRWRDHERWAITVEDWRSLRRDGKRAT